jgi:hypothetical protein
MELLTHDWINKIESRTKCQTFYFYPKTNAKGLALVRLLDSITDTYFTDLKEVSTAIRIYGTQEQIDKALDDYCEDNGLNVDEAYDFKPEAEGSRFYCKDENDEIKKALKRYTDIYLKKNDIFSLYNFNKGNELNRNRAIIINII